MGSTKINLTEEQFTEVTLSALKEHPEGITEYPILDFDDRALGLLSAGVAEIFLHLCELLFRIDTHGTELVHVEHLSVLGQPCL